MCKIRGCPYVNAELCAGHRLQQAGAWPLTRGRPQVDLSVESWDLAAEPQPVSTSQRILRPRGESALEGFARRLRERKAGRG